MLSFFFKTVKRLYLWFGKEMSFKNLPVLSGWSTAEGPFWKNLQLQDVRLRWRKCTILFDRIPPIPTAFSLLRDLSQPFLTVSPVTLGATWQVSSFPPHLWLRLYTSPLSVLSGFLTGRSTPVPLSVQTDSLELSQVQAPPSSDCGIDCGFHSLPGDTTATSLHHTLAGDANSQLTSPASASKTSMCF